MAKKEEVVVVTSPALLSFPTVWTPKLSDYAKPGAKPQYSATLLFKKGDPFLKTLKLKCLEVLLTRWPDCKEAVLAVWRAGGDIVENHNPELKLPFLNGDKPKYAEKYPDSHPGTEFIRIASIYKPAVLRVLGGEAVDIKEEADIYAGCIVRASVNIYVYPTDESKAKKESIRGVGIGLRSIIKIKDGPRLGGGGPANPDADYGDYSQYEFQEGGDAVAAAEGLSDDKLNF